MSRVDRYLEDLLAQRRPRPFAASEQEAAELRAGITLRAGQPGAADPDPEFIAALGERLATADPAEPLVRRRSPNRRLLVQTAAVAAASAAVAVGIDRLVNAPEDPDQQPQQTLEVDNGVWHTVVAAEQLPVGGVHEFDLGTVAGFVERTDAGLRAVSSACTHQGCKLVFQPAARELACPCHSAVFALTGTVLRYNLPVELTPLPLIPVRESGGAIQVRTPR